MSVSGVGAWDGLFYLAHQMATRAIAQIVKQQSIIPLVIPVSLLKLDRPRQIYIVGKSGPMLAAMRTIRLMHGPILPQDLEAVDIIIEKPHISTIHGTNDNMRKAKLFLYSNSLRNKDFNSSFEYMIHLLLSIGNSDDYVRFIGHKGVWKSFPIELRTFVWYDRNHTKWNGGEIMLHKDDMIAKIAEMLEQASPEDLKLLADFVESYLRNKK